MPDKSVGVRTRARRLGLVLLFLSALVEAGILRAAEPSFVTFSFQKRQFTLREPILLNLVVVNLSSYDMHVDLGDDSKGNFLISVTEPSGKVAMLGKKPPREGMTLPGKIQVKPGETYSQTLVLDEWYHFQEVGRYRISIALTAPLKNADASRPVEPFTSEIEIISRNPDQLAAVCRSLVARVQLASSVASSMEAANALSYVDDPVAVPFLEEILSDWRVVGIAISGLQRIRSQEAVAALIRALNLPEHDTALRARVALQLIAYETDDQTIRSMIKAALKE